MSGTRFSSEPTRRAIRVALGLFLVFPYLIWIARLREWKFPARDLWWPSLVTALAQATLSSAGAVALGCALFLGLQSWRRVAVAEAWLLVPNLVPPIFVGLALLQTFTLSNATPSGLAPVILAHVLLNAGLVAVALDRLVVARLGGQAEVAFVLGARRPAFWREIAWPQLRVEIARLFLFVFALAFTSFSLPLMLGGPRAATLEVAIYQLIRVDGRWDAAVLLAAVQTIALLILAFALPRDFAARPGVRGQVKMFTVPGLRWLVPLPALGLLAGMVRLGPLEPAVYAALPAATLATLAVGLGVGACSLVVFLAVAFVSPHPRLARLLNGYLAPSPAITGFGLLLVPGGWGGPKLVVALTLFAFPLLYRWGVHAALAGLESQITIARTLGAGWSAILFEIVWPQAARSILDACALAATWACGDFALSGILLDQGQTTLPLLIQDLLNSYRYDQAATCLLPLLAVCLAVYFFFRGARRHVTG